VVLILSSYILFLSKGEVSFGMIFLSRVGLQRSKWCGCKASWNRLAQRQSTILVIESSEEFRQEMMERVCGGYDTVALTSRPGDIKLAF
jgi:hypothetical protein